MSLLPIGRSPFPGSAGATADGSAEFPYSTDTSGQAGLDAIAAANTIATGDYAIIDRTGYPVMFRAIVKGARVYWYRNLFGRGIAQFDGVLEEDPGDDAGWTEVAATGGKVDWDDSVAGRVAVISGSSVGASMARSFELKAAATYMAIVLTDAKVDSITAGSSALIAAATLTTDTSAIGLGVADDTDTWLVKGSTEADLGITATTAATLELYYDAGEGRAYVAVDRGPIIQSVDVAMDTGSFAEMLAAVAVHANSTQHSLEFTSLLGVFFS